MRYTTRSVLQLCSLSPTRTRLHALPPTRVLSRSAPDEPTEADLAALGADNFGAFSVLFPPEPYIWGTAHIPPAPVPPLPARSIPPYVAQPPDAPFTGDPYEGDGRIALGSDAEQRLRLAARLATDVLRYAGGLVQVRVAECAGRDADARHRKA